MVLFLTALVVELVRQTFLPFKKLLNLSRGQAGGQKRGAEVEKTELEREVDTVRRELKEMQDEAERYNNPDTYARYGKIQRQIVQKEKVLQIMVKEALEERAKRAEEGPKQQAVKAPGFLNKAQVMLTGAYIFFFYLLPVYLVPRTYEYYETLIITQVSKPQLGYIYSILGIELGF